MKILKILLKTLITGAVAVSLSSCASDSNSTASAQNQIVTAQRSSLTIDVTAVGNLALARTEELAFDLFYPAGTKETLWTVEEVLVEEGDPVTEGEVLAKVDTSEWEEGLNKLEDAVTTAERQVTAKKRALLQTELNLLDAKNALEDAEAERIWPSEIFTAREAVWSAEDDVEEAKAMLAGGLVKEKYDRETGEVTVTIEEAKTAYDIEVWTKNLTDAEEKLGKARLELDTFLAQYYAEAKIALAEEKLRATQVKLDELIAKSVTEEELATQRRKVELAQEQVEEAKEAVEAVAKKKLQVEQAEGNIEDAHLAIDDAEKALEDARTNLDRARGKSPLITAPFAGFVIKVNVEGGDEIKTGTVAMVIADPNKFEADILVSEMDILQIKLAGEAWVQVDARPEIKLPAKVTHISPTATIQQGVVNYTVKVELQSLEGTIQQRQPASDNLSSANITSGAPARGFRQPFGSGNLTQEQIEQMRQPSQQARAGQTRSQSVEMPTRIAENFQLREGLTITVSIIVDERQNVLLVPNQAITRQGQETYVQVEKEGITEKRSIRTGISNYQFTEVIEGLSEGEQVIVPQGTATTVPATQSGQRQGGIFVPGVGRIR